MPRVLGKQPPNRRAFKRMVPFGGKSLAVLRPPSDNLHARSSPVLMGKRTPKRPRKLSHKIQPSPTIVVRRVRKRQIPRATAGTGRKR